MARAIVARILPMTTPEEEAEAIIWEEDTILQVGSEQAVADMAAQKGIEVERMPGRTIIPGFVDAHTHFLHIGVKRSRPDLRGAKSKQEALARVQAWMREHDDGHVTAEGWDESAWDDGIPTRAELDQLSDRPLVMRRICGHMAVANTPALQQIRKEWDDERVDATTGLLLEEPSLYLNEVLPAGPAILERALDQACLVAHQLGVTTVGDYEQAPFREALMVAARDKRLRIRLTCSIYVQQLEQAIARGFRTGRAVAAAHEEEAVWELASAESEGAGPTSKARLATALGQEISPPPQDHPESLLCDGGLKVFLDGSLGGHTAHMLQPYEDRDTRGRANFSDQELDAIFRRAHDAGIQIHAHAIGDGAVEQGLQAFERLADALRREGKGPIAWGGQSTLPAPPAPSHGRSATSATASRADAGEHSTAAGHPSRPTGAGSGTNADGTTTRGDPRSPGAGGLSRGTGSIASTDGPSPVAGHRFEHFEIVHDSQAQRAAALGLWASSQPNFVGEWSAHGGMYEQRIGERFALNNRFRTWKDLGLRVAFGSDGMPFGPLYGIQSAVDHPVAQQRMSPREAVWHHTHEAAASLGRHEVGSLRVGNKADLLILDMAGAPRDWIIRETIAAGTTVHRGTRPMLSDDDVAS